MVNIVLDPYFELLAIPPSEQPPTLYRLLGVPPFTENKSVITNAAAQRLQFLRRVGGEKYFDEVQRILNEVVEAKILLMNDASRQSYDVRLRSNQEAAEQTAERTALAATQTASPNIPKIDARDDYRLVPEPEGLDNSNETTRPRPPATPNQDNDRVIRRDEFSDTSSNIGATRSYHDSYVRSPALRPLKTWDTNIDTSIIDYSGKGRGVGPARPSFPTRQQAAERKAQEIRKVIERADDQQHEPESSKPIAFSEPQKSKAAKPSVIVFLNGALAGTAVELTNTLHYFRLRKSGIFLPVIGHSVKKPNIVFQENAQGWHCVTTRSVVVNNRIHPRGLPLKSGDVVRITMNGPELLWLDPEERFTESESQMITPPEVAARAVMGQLLNQTLQQSETQNQQESVKPAHRNSTVVRPIRKDVDPNRLVKNIAWTIAGLIAVFITVRQIFFS